MNREEGLDGRDLARIESVQVMLGRNKTQQKDSCISRLHRAWMCEMGLCVPCPKKHPR